MYLYFIAYLCNNNHAHLKFYTLVFIDILNLYLRYVTIIHIMY